MTLTPDPLAFTNLVPPYLVYEVLGLEHKSLCMPGKHSAPSPSRQATVFPLLIGFDTCTALTIT